MVTFLFSCGGKPDLQKGYKGEEEGAFGGGSTVSISYLKSLYTGRPLVISGQISFEGRVVSNDGTGNFYKSVVIQDETGGIEVKLDMEDIFKTFWFGNKVRIFCNGLTLGAYGGVVQLGEGSGSGYETGYVSYDKIASHVRLINDSSEEPLPSVISLSGLDSRYINCLVKFENVQFIDEDAGKPWCDPESDSQYTQRIVTDAAGKTLAVRTSNYSTFANYSTPVGNGSITGILGYFNGTYQLSMLWDYDAVMEGERF